MLDNRLQVCLIAPLPPPHGGIANWTRLVQLFTMERKDIRLEIIDIAARWRAVEDLTWWKRVAGGGIQLVRDYLRFRCVLRARPDVIHLTTSGQLAVIRDYAIMLTARWYNIPTIYHLHFGRVPAIFDLGTWECRVLRRALCLATTVIAIDRPSESAIRQHLPALRTLLIPNGVDLNELRSVASEEVIRMVLFLGWVIPSKGVEELIQAWVELEPKGFHCVIAGPGSEEYRKELQLRYRPENLEFLPAQSHDDAMRLMAACSVLALPSYTEGLPYVVLEAMAIGRAIVASSVGAIPDMLSGDCGVLVPPRDAGALCDALRRVLIDANLRAAMGERAQRKTREEYTMDKVFGQLVDLWSEHARV